MTLAERIQQYPDLNLMLIVHHDDSIPEEWRRACSQTGVVMRDQTRLGLRDHQRMLWRFLEIADHECSMVLDLDEDLFPFLHKIREFRRHPVHQAIANQSSDIFTCIPEWKVAGKPCILPASFLIFTHAKSDAFLSNIKMHILDYLATTSYKYRIPGQKKPETRVVRGATYQIDEYFLNFILLLQTEATVYRAPMMHISIQGSTKNVSWTPFSLVTAEL